MCLIVYVYVYVHVRIKGGADVSVNRNTVFTSVHFSSHKFCNAISQCSKWASQHSSDL